MKTKMLIIAVLLSSLTKAQVFARPDALVYHMYSGAGISAVSGAVLYGTTKKPGLSILGGFAVAALAGGGKELIWDMAMNKGTASWGDFWATTWGATVGSLVVGVGISVHKSKKVDAGYFQDMDRPEVGTSGIVLTGGL